MLELEHRFRVVDVNATLAPESDTGDRGRAIGPDQLEREMHQAGIVRSVVFPERRDERTDYLTANNSVARRSVDRPFVAFARLTGPREPGSATTSTLRNLAARRKPHHTDPETVEQFAYDDRFHGFVLAPGTDGLPDESVLETLEDVDLPVVVEAGLDCPPTALTDSLLDAEFTVVLASFGGYPLQTELMHDAISLLDSYDDCYLDTSFVHFRDPLERALLEHPDRVLFASGAPGAHPNVAVMEILTLDVSEDKMTRAFSNNATRIVPELAPESDES
jgi:predicted TIM-barrel fold metal-dependent hydrolase